VDDLDVSQSFSWAELYLGKGGSAARALKITKLLNASPIPLRESRGKVTAFAGLLTGSVFRRLFASVLDIWPAHMSSPPSMRVLGPA
jgi:hypothetical protein